MADTLYDIVVIGGGINGAGIAADASGRGLRVLLAEAGDLGGATSSASSKLIHGGLRYLEHYKFRLVREALAEREVLLAAAPHIVRPLRFVLPHVEGMRSPAMLRAGLFLYDHLSSRKTLGGSRSVDLRADAAGQPLAADLRRGFTYWDCWVDDARLVVLNAIAARDKGAQILTRTPVTGLSVEDGVWRVTVGDGDAATHLHGRAVVNASGPWVGRLAELAAGGAGPSPVPVRLVKGAHIVVPRIAAGADAYIFQSSDRRVVFALPFEDAFTLIGTTDTPFAGDPREVSVTADDQTYLLAVANRFLRQPLKVSDIVWQFAGVRPLDDDGQEDVSAVSRDYRLQLDTSRGPPIVHVIGGKITTYRRLAEAALVLLSDHIPMGPTWTSQAALPGGDMGNRMYSDWFAELARQFPEFEVRELSRLARRYGTRTASLLQDAEIAADLGRDLGGGVRLREVQYLAREEFAKRADDVMWRRTKAALHVRPGEREAMAINIQRAIDAV